MGVHWHVLEDCYLVVSTGERAPSLSIYFCLFTASYAFVTPSPLERYRVHSQEAVNIPCMYICHDREAV
jgi:hypothetical protein